MNSAAQILPFPHHDDGHGRAARGGEAEPFAPFVDPGEAERVLGQGQPGDELSSFLRRSLARLGQSVPAQPVEPLHAAPAPAADARREAAALPPEHPAYEAPRPAPVDLTPRHQAAYGFEAHAGHHGQYPAYAPQAAPTPAPSFPDPLPAPPVHRSVPPVAGAPEGDAGSFEIPSFLRARPGIPQPAAEPAAVRQAPAAPASPVQPAPRAPTAPARSQGAAAAVAGELLWIYSVFPVILVLQTLAGVAWEPLASFAATFAFVTYAAVGAAVRPALFQLRVSAGWQLVATAAVFRGLDTTSPEQWMHMFAAFAAAAVVAVAMGGIEVFSRLRGR